jgi:hypothetical protein
VSTAATVLSEHADEKDHVQGHGATARKRVFQWNGLGTFTLSVHCEPQRPTHTKLGGAILIAGKVPRGECRGTDAKLFLDEGTP